jgi:hypothetical protein
MLWIPAQVFLWLDYARTGTLGCWQVLLSVNGSMIADHHLRCRVTRALRKVTSSTYCVAIAFREQGTRKHNKTGVVERGNGILKDFIKRLVLDIQSQVAGSATNVFTVPEIVSQATYFKNMLVSKKMLSAFEHCRGYQPSLCGLHRDFVTPGRVAAHDEMVARRALPRACSKRNVNELSCSELSPGTEILFYFKDIVKKDVLRWQIGYIADRDDNFATIRRNGDGRGCGLKIALEDIQLMPTSPLLQRLFDIEIFDPEVSTQLPGRVEIPVTSGSAQAPDFVRTEALSAFDAVRTTKRTPLEMDVGVDVQVEERPSPSTIDDLSRV